MTWPFSQLTGISLPSHCVVQILTWHRKYSVRLRFCPFVVHKLIKDNSMPHHRHLISAFLLLFWFSGYLKVVRWQIQGLEKTSQEEVSEHRQPDSHAVVPGHHLLTLAYQQGDRPVRCTVQYLCLVRQIRQTREAVLWINKSVSNTHT